MFSAATPMAWPYLTTRWPRGIRTTAILCPSLTGPLRVIVWSPATIWAPAASCRAATQILSSRCRRTASFVEDCVMADVRTLGELPTCTCSRTKSTTISVTEAVAVGYSAKKDSGHTPCPVRLSPKWRLGANRVCQLVRRSIPAVSRCGRKFQRWQQIRAALLGFFLLGRCERHSGQLQAGVRSVSVCCRLGSLGGFCVLGRFRLGRLRLLHGRRILLQRLVERGLGRLLGRFFGGFACAPPSVGAASSAGAVSSVASAVSGSASVGSASLSVTWSVTCTPAGSNSDPTRPETGLSRCHLPPKAGYVPS